MTESAEKNFPAYSHLPQGESVNILLKFAQFFKTSIEYFL